MPRITIDATPHPTAERHHHYNTDNYPIFVGRDAISSRRTWDLYANERGYLASIAVDEGRSSSHMGDAAHVRGLILNYDWPWELSEAGADLIGREFIERVNSQETATSRQPAT